MKSLKKEKRKWYKDILKKTIIKNSLTNARDKFSNFVDLPLEVASKTTKMTLIENKNVLIEGYKQIIDYYENYIKIRAQNIDIIIDGKNLDIKEITDFELVIGGTIYSINYKNN